MIDTQAVRTYLLGLQQRIVDALQQADGKTFHTDAWVRPHGERLQGDGRTQLVEEGGLLERGGCNFSHVKGPQLPPSATQHRPELAGAPFEAYLSLVRGAVDNVAELGPAAALTGPAARGDELTIARHLAAIDPSERDAYRSR